MSSAETAAFAHPHTNVGNFKIEPGMTVVDFGAGSGHYVLAIAERLRNQGHVYAIDIQKDLLTRIKNDAHKKGYKNVEIIWGDLERAGASKIADELVDVVLVSNLLFQVEDKQAPLAEAMRILKLGGSLYVIDWAESFDGLGPIRKHVFKKDAAITLVKGVGFMLIDEFDAGAHHYGLAFIKTNAYT